MPPPTAPAWNPQLVVPQGAWSDSQYQADEANLRANIIGQYHDVLDQLGYTDPGGNVVEGGVQVASDRQDAAYQRALAQAALDVTNASQREGTMFSGRRADREALAQQPYNVGRANLVQDTASTLSRLGTRATDLLNNYQLGVAPLVTGAISRYTPPAITPPTPPTGIVNAGTNPAGAASGYTGTGSATDPFVSSGAGPIVSTPAQGATDTPRSQGRIPAMAAGGVVNQPTQALVGEAGPEAVVPLQGGLQAALARFIAMAGGGKSFGQGIDEANYQPPRQAQPAQQQRTAQQGAQKKPPNVHAAGLKAAAAVMSELAKHHEQAGGQIPLAPPPNFEGPLPGFRPQPPPGFGRQPPALRFAPPLQHAGGNLGTLV